MKICQDLRIAINAAAEASKANCDRHSQYKKRQDALAAFQKQNTAKSKIIKRHVASIASAKQAIAKAEAALEQMGIDTDYRGNLSIGCDDKFRKAGGKISQSKLFTGQQVVFEYVGAKTQKEADAVLAKYGIVWK